MNAETLIEVVDLAKAFGRLQAVEGLTLSLAAGEVVGFIGGNGEGKSTGLRLMAGLLAADSGSGQVLGYDVIAARDDIRARVGFMSQAHALYNDLTLRENLAARARLFGLGQVARRVEAAIAEHNLGPVALQRAGDLSGGWLRRAQVATTLIHEPRLIILDEPTAGLDLVARDHLWRQILDLAGRGHGILVSTHDLAEAAALSRVALIRRGRIIAQGQPSALAKAHGGDLAATLRAATQGALA